MQKYTNNVTDLRGNALIGATVTVTVTNGGAIATLYSDNGVTTLSNPVSTDSEGEFFFYAANNKYTLTTLYNSSTVAVTDIALFDPDDTGAMSSANVTFAQSGTGAVATTVQTELRRIVWADQFYTVQQAVDDADVVLFRSATYNFTDDLTISKNVKLVGKNTNFVFAAGKKLIMLGAIDAGAAPSTITAGDSTITVATSLAKDDVVWINGDDSTTPAADLTLSTNTLSAAVNVTASASVFSSGDVGKCIIVGTNIASVYITGYTSGTLVNGYISNNNAPSSTSISSGGWSLRTNFSPSRPYYERGEMCRVYSYAAGVATLDSPVFETYVGTDCTVYKMTGYSVEIDGIKIQGEVTNNSVVTGTYLVDSLFKNMKVTNTASGGFGIYLIKCFDTELDNTSADADGYSTFIHGCQRINVEGGKHLSDASHAIEVSSGSDTPPCRQITVRGSTAISRQDLYALNTHGGVSEVRFLDCEAIGGAALYGQNSSLENCKVSIGTAARVALRLYPEVNGDFIKAIDCTVFGGTGINYRENFAGVGATDVTVDGNTGACGQGFVLDVNSSYDAMPFATQNVSLTGNDLTADAGNCIDFNAGSKVGTGVANHMKSFRLVANQNLRSTSADGVYIRGNNRLQEAVLVGNRIEGAASNDGFDIANVVSAIVTGGNEVVGAGAGGNTNSIAATVEYVVCTDNLFRNFTVSRGLVVTNTSDRRNNIIGNNQFNSCTGTLPSWVRYPFVRFNGDNNTWASSTAAPAGSTWAVADIIWNSVTGPGLPLGWVCTVAGTPGTWVPFGHVETAVAVASLPAAATAGATSRMFVTDANATTFASIVAGGGANYVPVYSDGTNWRIG